MSLRTGSHAILWSSMVLVWLDALHNTNHCPMSTGYVLSLHQYLRCPSTACKTKPPLYLNEAIIERRWVVVLCLSLKRGQNNGLLADRETTWLFEESLWRDSKVGLERDKIVNKGEVLGLRYKLKILLQKSLDSFGLHCKFLIQFLFQCMLFVVVAPIVISNCLMRWNYIS